MSKAIYRIMGIIVSFALVMAGFTKVQATSSQQISGRPVYVYYYLWWSTKHWQDKLGPNYPYGTSPLPLPAVTDADGCNPTSNYAGNQLLDVPPALVGQDDPGAIEADILAAKAIGVTGFWLNWVGDGTTTQTRTTVTYTRRLSEAFAASNRVGGFKNWVSYKVASMQPVSYIINDLNFLYNTFQQEAGWERIDGKPVVTFTGSRKYSDADLQVVSNAVRDRIFLVGDETRTTLTPARIAMFDAITYYWSSQDPWGNPQSFSQIKEMGDKVHAAGKRWYAPLNPGYNSTLLDGSGTCVPRRNGETLRALWNGNLASNPDGWGLISWNEIAENTHIKPLQKWGGTYLNVLASLVASSQPAKPPTPTPTPNPFRKTWYISGQGSYSFGEREDIPVVADYNGDGKDDIAVYRPSNGTWYLKGMGSTVWGIPNDIPVAGDYNGDGKAEIAVYRPSNGTWYLKGMGSTVWGIPNDIPVAGDYNGDGKVEIAVYRPSNGTWYIKGIGATAYGLDTDIPVVADYNGDRKVEMAVFRPSNSTWYIRGMGQFAYGKSSDIPVVADYNGDGKADIAMFRPSNSTWYIRGIGNSTYGIVGDAPIVADYNGDGKADIAIVRPPSK